MVSVVNLVTCCCKVLTVLPRSVSVKGGRKRKRPADPVRRPIHILQSKSKVSYAEQIDSEKACALNINGQVEGQFDAETSSKSLVSNEAQYKWMSQSCSSSRSDPNRVNIDPEDNAGNNGYNTDRNRHKGDEQHIDKGGDYENCSHKEKQHDGSDEGNDEEEGYVKERASEQREAEPGDPICVVCGRYGEYICDETDDDVCSMECKAEIIRRSQNVQPGYCADRQSVLVTSDHPSPALTHHGYEEHEEVRELTEEQLTELRDELEIHIGDNAPRLIFDFSHCLWSEKLAENVANMDFRTPTAVQMQTIPIVLSGRDALVASPTGTGKSAAFVLPLIQRVQNWNSVAPSSNPFVLILAPTRELCMQLEAQIKAFIAGIPRMRTALIVGGFPMPPQVYRLKRGVQFVLATPGRLHQLLLRHHELAFLDDIKTVVVDEVDTMLSMGFEEKVKELLLAVPRSRQTLLFSATIPKSIEKSASKLFFADASPIVLTVGEKNAVSEAVTQTVLWVPEKLKKQKLLDLIMDESRFRPPLVVFVSSRTGAELLGRTIEITSSVRTGVIHGAMDQNSRVEALAAFLEGTNDILVATGLIGRGIDLVKVRQVVHFDLPRDIQAYIHQIGRAGRLGEKGEAVTFVNDQDSPIALRQLAGVLKRTMSECPSELRSFLHNKTAGKESHSNNVSSLSGRSTKKQREELQEMYARLYSLENERTQLRAWKERWKAEATAKGSKRSSESRTKSNKWLIP